MFFLTKCPAKRKPDFQEAQNISRQLSISKKNDEQMQEPLSLVVSTHLKNISQIGSSSPGRGENKTYLKPPPSLSSQITVKCVGNLPPYRPAVTSPSLIASCRGTRKCCKTSLRPGCSSNFEPMGWPSTEAAIQPWFHPGSLISIGDDHQPNSGELYKHYKDVFQVGDTVGASEIPVNSPVEVGGLSDWFRRFLYRNSSPPKKWLSWKIPFKFWDLVTFRGATC